MCIQFAYKTCRLALIINALNHRCKFKRHAYFLLRLCLIRCVCKKYKAFKSTSRSSAVIVSVTWSVIRFS